MGNTRGETIYRYYLTQKPAMQRTSPRFAANVVCFDDSMAVANLTSRAWGYVEYESPLTLKQLRKYELREAGPFYVSRETGEMLSKQMMLKLFRENYDGDDPTTGVDWDEYFDEVR